MAGHPLRPATDQSLGEPLPHQLANRARAPPQTALRPLSPGTGVPGMSCGISSPFGELSPIRGQIAHVLRTRAPCAHFLYCYRKLRTRLACVKHAASVRSEPGSNSHLKLVSCEAIHRWRIAPFTICRFERTNLLNRSVFHSIPACAYREHRANQTGSGTSQSIVKELDTSWPAGRSTDERA